MNRNQKIAVGCGGLGCLGLIVVAIAIGFVLYLRSNATGGSYNFNSTSNSNSNSKHTGNTNANQNTSDSANTNSSNATVSSMSDDDKHKLFQAAGITQDQELMKRVLQKMGFIKPNGMISDDYAQFVKDHISWAIKNTAFINSINTPEKAKAYVDEHFAG